MGVTTGVTGGCAVKKKARIALSLYKITIMYTTKHSCWNDSFIDILVDMHLGYPAMSLLRKSESERALSYDDRYGFQLALKTWRYEWNSYYIADYSQMATNVTLSMSTIIHKLFPRPE